MSDIASFCYAFLGVLLIGSNRLKKSDLKPVRLLSTTMAFLLFLLMLSAVQLGPYLGLDHAERVDTALGTLLGAVFGVVTDELRSAILEATGNHSLAISAYPLLMLAVAPQIIVTPLSDKDGLTRPGIVAFLIGTVVSLVAVMISNRRASSSNEPRRLSGLACAATAGIAAAIFWLIQPLNLLDLSSAEWNRLSTFAAIGIIVGVPAEAMGWHTKCPAVALIVATGWSLIATSGVGSNLILGSTENVSRAIELAGLITGVSFVVMIERGILNKYRQRRP